MVARDRELVTILKNGLVVSVEYRAADLSIYCENPITDEDFVIEESFKFQQKPLKISVTLSSDEKSLFVSIALRDRRQSPFGILFHRYRVGIENGFMSELSVHSQAWG